ncbi:hypothetical protein AtNW77_Chr1g0010771 [Arabidopsis thaliana]
MNQLVSITWQILFLFTSLAFSFVQVHCRLPSPPLMERMNMSEEEEQCKRNQEAFKRFFEQIPRTAVIGMLSFFLHGQMSKFEKAPSKPLSNAFAFASVGYVVLQVAHGFARANRPSSFAFDFLSVLCGLASVAILFTAIFND